MEGSDGLDTIAEIAIALAGFSGIVVAFIHRKGQMQPLDRLRLGVLLVAAFGAVFLAMLPFALFHLGFSGPTLWAVASGFHAVVASLVIAGMAIVIRRFFATYREIFNLLVIIPILCLYTADVVLQVMNLSGLGWNPGVGAYFVGLLWLVSHAALQFFRIIFVRPIVAEGPSRV